MLNDADMHTPVHLSSLSCLRTGDSDGQYMTARKLQRWIRQNLPSSKLARWAVGLLLIIGGILGFLPVLGFWMLPLGLYVLSMDSRPVRRFRRRLDLFFGRAWYRLRNRLRGERTRRRQKHRDGKNR